MADGPPCNPLLRSLTRTAPPAERERRVPQGARGLLVEEIELDRHIARVAAQRRALPPGGEVKGDYQFMGEASSVTGANPSASRRSSATRTPFSSTTGCMARSASALAPWAPRS